MKRVDLIKAIEGCGCQLVRHGAKHDWYQNPQPALPSQFRDIAKLKNGWRSESSVC